MLDKDLRLLQKRAIDDPLFRDVYIERAIMCGQYPNESQTLDWERDYLDREAKRLRSKRLDFGRRFLFHFLQKLGTPLIVGIYLDDIVCFRFVRAVDTDMGSWKSRPNFWSVDGQLSSEYENDRETLYDIFRDFYDTRRVTTTLGDRSAWHLHKIVDGQVAVFAASDTYDYGEDALPAFRWSPIPYPFAVLED